MPLSFLDPTAHLPPTILATTSSSQLSKLTCARNPRVRNPCSGCPVPHPPSFDWQIRSLIVGATIRVVQSLFNSPLQLESTSPSSSLCLVHEEPNNSNATFLVAERFHTPKTGRSALLIWLPFLLHLAPTYPLLQQFYFLLPTFRPHPIS